MVSMEIKEGCCYEPTSMDKYGYGLKIYLTDEQVAALGLDKNPPKAGSKVRIQAIAIVQEVSSRSDSDDKPEEIDVSLCLQITDMEVTGERTVDAASVLYAS